jgi:hypothetical protein
MNERDMAEALGLSMRRENVRIAQPVQTVVIMSAKPPVGPPEPFTHVCATVSRTLAVIEANRAARAAGLEPWFLIDVEVMA